MRRDERKNEVTKHERESRIELMKNKRQPYAKNEQGDGEIGQEVSKLQDSLLRCIIECQRQRTSTRDQ